MAFANKVAEAFVPSQISASASVHSGTGVLGGIFCSSSSSGTCTIYDNTAASGTKIADTFSLTAGQTYPFSAKYNTGLYVALGGTASVTVLYVNA